MKTSGFDCARKDDESMVWRLKLGALFIPIVFLGGCATVQLNAGFVDVGASVEERAGMSVSWNNGSDLDRAAEERVRALLKNRLTADQAVQVALLTNRELQALYSDLGIAQADLVQAGLLRNPIFDAAVTFPVSGGRAEPELTAVMNFLDVLYMPLRKRIAAARFAETKLRVTGSVLDFAGQVRRAFYFHQANEQMLELRQTIVEGLASSFLVAERLHQAGNISDLDFARERALLETGKLALRSAESAVSQSRERLNMLMGLWGSDAGWDIDKRMADVPTRPPDTETLEKVSIEKSLDLEIAKQRLVTTGEQLGFAKSTALVPQWGMGMRGERRDGPWSVGPVLEFPIPLFDQGQARTGRAGAELRRAQQEYYALAVRIRSTARAVRDRLLSAHDRALYSRDILVPLRESIVNEAQRQYNAMQLGVFELLRAREQQIEAGVAYVEALRDYVMAASDLTQLMSGSLPESNTLRPARTFERMRVNESEGH
jgi:outer membrane protein, heavy metal efflux system